MVQAELEALWVKLEQILQLKVDYSDFDPFKIRPFTVHTEFNSDLAHFLHNIGGAQLNIRGADALQRY